MAAVDLLNFPQNTSRIHMIPCWAVCCADINSGHITVQRDPVISEDFVRSVQDSLVVLGYYPAMTHLQTCLFKYTVTYHNIFGLQAFPND